MITNLRIINLSLPFQVMKGFFILKDEGILNSTGFVRGMMSKSMETEMYLTHVVETIRRQLEKWEENYEVKLHQDLIDETNYEVIVTIEDKTYHDHLDFEPASALQDKSHYSLDRHIWESLKSKGLVIEQTHGDYLDKCYM